MKQRRKDDFALGLLTLICLALFVATIIVLVPGLRREGRRVVIHFDHDAGLAPIKAGSAVLLADSQTAGTVEDVRIREVRHPEAGYRVVFEVVIRLRSGVPLYGNCRVTTNQPAIGGPGHVSILNVGTPDVALTEPVRGLPPQSLAAAISSLSDLLIAEDGLVPRLSRAVDPAAEGSLLFKVLASLDDVNALTRELRAQMSPQEHSALLGKVHRLLDDLNATTGALRAEMARSDDTALAAKLHVALAHLDDGLVELTGILRENREPIRRTVASVEHAATTVDAELLAVLRAELDPARPDCALGKVHRAMDRANAVLQNLETISDEGKRVVVTSRPELEKVLSNVLDMSTQLLLASQDVRLNPSKLIWGPSGKRDQQLLVFQAAGHFAKAAGELDQAARRLEAILKTLPPGGEVGELERAEVKAVHDAVRAAFDRFERAENALWEQLK